MGRKEKVELLSPAGSPEGFYGAVHAGADAVYLAGNEYGARAYADNFSVEELSECIRYAHIWHRKVYLTVNTLVKEEELERLPDFLKPLAEAGLDGVIVQDFGVLSVVRRQFPSLPLHASTQMTVTGPYGARLLKELGVVRIVPARELSLEEILTLKRESGLEVECFIHGAMCYSYSGQCLFSSIVGGRSGNRGRCAQPCRLPYRLQTARKSSTGQYPLSMKDLCALEILPELAAAGIDSLKIEGRMKKPEYAAAVTALYRKYLDRIQRGENAAPGRKDLELLQGLYLRSGIQEGYYHRRNGKEMMTLDSPAYNGSDEEVLADIRRKLIDTRPTIPVRMKAFFQVGQPAQVWISQASKPEEWHKVTGEVVQSASKTPVTRENLIRQLSKLGESCFSLDESFCGGRPEIHADTNAFYPLKAVNELRRKAVSALEEVRIHER